MSIQGLRCSESNDRQHLQGVINNKYRSPERFLRMVQVSEMCTHCKNRQLGRGGDRGGGGDILGDNVVPTIFGCCDAERSVPKTCDSLHYFKRTFCSVMGRVLTWWASLRWVRSLYVCFPDQHQKGRAFSQFARHASSILKHTARAPPSTKLETPCFGTVLL